MAILYRTLTIDRFWVLLEGYAAFASIIASARRVKDTQEGWLKRLVLRGVGDFPHVRIEMGNRFTGGPIPITDFNSEPGGFGDGASDYWEEERTSEFKLSFFYETPNFDKQDELEMTAIEALESGGRNLGYDPITGWGPWRGDRSGTAMINDIAYPVTQIIVPVKYQFTGSQLKPS